ncbi:conserved hypothetical protein [Candidatus Desulfosporosinus infrequens]|uniref:Uncharacterized protein n=1 Tax=Candidatus Desulfosporosinus infrequens TaxID=2043169 RepID=A0A2U3LHC8_9FIRM|nr:conserved hypothetical protein [Candidatus Desulfosporosinus infrequens]
MNLVAYGKQRDERIMGLVGLGTAFTRSQIERVIFKGSKRKAQTRLQVLSDSGRLKKIIRSPHEPAIYCLKKPRNIDHYLLINEIYCAVMSQKKSWHIVKWQWSYPIMEGKIWADAMVDIYDQLNKRRHVIFVEVERYADRKFEKDKKYSAITSANWTKEEWAIKEPTRILFPAILVVTECKLEVKSELDFFVATMDQVKKDIYSIILRR